MYHASVFLCCKFERDRWSQRSTSRQKLLRSEWPRRRHLDDGSCPQWLVYDLQWLVNKGLHHTDETYRHLFYTAQNIQGNMFLAATKQLYKRYFPSLRHTFLTTCSHHRIIMKFSGIITNDQSKIQAKGQSQRSKVKVTEVTTQLNRFRTVTPVWIHIWWWNDAYSLMLLRRGALSFLKVIRQISRSHVSKNRRIWPRLGISGL